MKTAQTLRLEFEDESGRHLPLVNIFVNISFSVNERFCYAFRFGPSDEHGQLLITYENVEAKRLLAAKANLMDYNTPLSSCDERIQIEVPTGKELREAYEWQARWFSESTPREDIGWLDAANAKISANPMVVELQLGETLAVIHCTSIR